MAPAFFFFLVIVVGLVGLIAWLGTRLQANRVVTAVWAIIAGLAHATVTQGYLVDAFRVIDSGTWGFVAVPIVGAAIALGVGTAVWAAKRSVNLAIRGLALTLLAFDFAAIGWLGAASPF